MARVLLQPAGNEKDFHFKKTILNPVSIDLLEQYLDNSKINSLRTQFPQGLVPTWGLVPGKRNDVTWQDLSVGDIACFIKGKTFAATGKVVLKARSPELARELWGIKDVEGTPTWELMYFLDDIREFNKSKDEFKAGIGVKKTDPIQGTRLLSDVDSEEALDWLGLAKQPIKYWWVNHRGTRSQETQGGYIWAPKTKSNGAFSKGYDNLRKVEVGDRIFSYANREISMIGEATSEAFTAPKPLEFKATENTWSDEGWLVHVDWETLEESIHVPNIHNKIKELLPNEHSPLDKNGNGNEGIYLAKISGQLASALMQNSGLSKAEIEKEGKSDRIVRQIRRLKISETEKTAFIKSRRGQGRFREDVLALHKMCPFTKVSNTTFLHASHIKGWADCDTNEERIDPENGLPLSLIADRLFDKHLVSFDDDGSAIYSSKLDQGELMKLGIDITKEVKIPIRSQKQLEYIRFHRKKSKLQ